MSIELEKLYSLYKNVSSVTADPHEPPEGSLYVALKSYRPKTSFRRFIWHIWCGLEMYAPSVRKIAVRLAFFVGFIEGTEAGDYVYDGNAYVKQALANGAAHALIDNRRVHRPPKTHQVADATETLYALAQYHRDQIKHPIIGITGSVGKTTTTNLVHAVLNSEKNSIMGGQRNTPAANSINLLNIPKGTDTAVFEMATLRPKLLAGASNIIRPTHALITTIDHAHLDTFKDLAEIQTSKWELFEHIIQTGGTAFVNMNHAWLASQADKLSKAVRYGSGPDCDVVGHMLSADPYLKMRWFPKGQDRPIDIQTKLAGQHNVDNILAAIAVGTHFGVSNEAIKQAIENFETVRHRSEIFYSGSNTIYCETYQSNPASTLANLDSFASYNAKHKILIIGPIQRTPSEHIVYDQIVEKIESMGLDQVFFMTGEYDRFRDRKVGMHVSGRDEIKVWLDKNRPEDTCIMLNCYHGYYDVRSLFPETARN